MSQTEMIFNLQMTMGLIFWALAAWWFILPKLNSMAFRDALLLPLLIAVLRFHGTNFLVPEINNGLSLNFATPAAYGDLAVCILALVAGVAVRLRSNAGLMLAWAYAVLGALDFINGFYLGNVNDMPHHLGATWFMVTYEAPLEIMALFILVRLLLKHPGRKLPL